MKRIIIILTILITYGKLYSQDPQVSQLFFSTYYIAPSFAGFTDGSRASLLYRNQWPSVQKEFVTYAFSADHYFARFKSGLGVFFLQDKAGIGNLTTKDIALQYAYHLTINRGWSFRPGLQIYYQSRSLDFSKLVFGDQLSLTGINPYTIEVPTMEKIGYVDFATSLLVEYKTAWGGLAIDHLATPNQSFYETGKSYLPLTYKIYGGYKRYEKGDNGKYKENSYSIMFLYKAQAKFDQLDIGGFWIHQPLLIGLWYRGLPIFKSYKGNPNNDAFIFMFGYYKEKITIVYSYDLTISRLKTNTGGANEITLNYLFNQDMKLMKKRKKIIIACPKYDPLKQE